VTTPRTGDLRAARLDDSAQLVRLWALLFDEVEATPEARWRSHAREWFARYVDDGRTAAFPVIEVERQLVAAAIGTLEIGAPNPQCPSGRAVRLANVITLPDHRGQGHGTRVAREVIDWARGIGADRVDLSATPSGQRLYRRLGFTPTSAPRMKLVL
jgi:ribosomal protein S18 acetylase RimI-like enzyme